MCLDCGIFLKLSVRNPYIFLMRFFTNYLMQPSDLCGSDHELLIAKFRLKLKKVGYSAFREKYEWASGINIGTYKARLLPGG